MSSRSPPQSSMSLPRNNPSEGFLPNEIFPQETEAIDDLIETNSAPPELLNSLLIDPFENLDAFSVDNYIPDLPGIITARAPLSEKLSHEEEMEGLMISPRVYQEKRQEIENLFAGFDWSNVVIAGGYALSMLGALSPGSQVGDIDLFIYGLSNGLNKVYYIINFFRQIHPNLGVLFRTKRAVTMVLGDKIPPIQIVLRNYHTPAEILIGFDLPCVRVLFDGQGILMLRSARNAIVNRYNVLTGYQPFRTGSYERRAIKYLNRGYDIRILNFEPSRVNQDLYKKNYRGFPRGLALILYTLNQNPNKREIFLESYDPLANVISDLSVDLTSEQGVTTGDIRRILFAYSLKNIFTVAFEPREWDVALSDHWNPNEAFETVRGRKSLRIPNLVPLELIGSSQEYLEGLSTPLMMGQWEQEAYSTSAVPTRRH